MPAFTPDFSSYVDLKRLLWAWAGTQPRILSMFMVLPLFNKQLVPGLLRLGMASAFGLLAAPALLTDFAPTAWTIPGLLLLTLKEAFLGFVIGYFFAVPFWLFQAVGFFIDNQRGASIGSTLDPLTGNDTSPLGMMFMQAFIVYFLASGGMQLFLGTLYDSFRLWPPSAFMPHLGMASVPLFLDQLDRLTGMAVVLASPVLIVMFLAEMGLALISRFVPQLQVFFIAMPVKSALAFLVLTLYLGVLFTRTTEIVDGLHTVLPFLNGQWRS